ncbi:extracellular solute-binding protein [Gorillibacterium sp. sgz500922]|uniref:extracellular solute-binding protein n=1 Tax=Gorillibacterium sp. sgz500922 TaxID=3446694 RepID=UPI003F6692FE
MKHRLHGLLVVLLIILLSGCSSPLATDSPIKPVASPSAAGIASGEPPVLKVLVPSDIPKVWREELTTLASTQNIAWVYVNKNDAAAYLDALTEERPPDLVLFDEGMLGELRGLDLFEDLGGAAYGAFSYANLFPGLSLNPYKSMDRNRLVAFPLGLFAKVTLYRADLLAANGFPSDPEVLGDYLEDPERWLGLGTKLAHKGIRTQEWKTDGLDFLMTGQGYFRDDGSFVRSSADLVKKLGAVRDASRNGMSAERSVDSTPELVREGKIAMLYGPEWKLEGLRQTDPVFGNEWRMTRLPMGTYGASDSLLFAIPRSGSHPAEAWAFAKAWLEREKAAGSAIGSKAGVWCSRFPDTWPTPLDRRADQIWRATVLDYLFDGSKTPTQAVATAYAHTLGEIGTDLHSLFAVLRQSSR